eukprot:764321-Hanusia_phi.AAC.7
MESPMKTHKVSESKASPGPSPKPPVAKPLQPPKRTLSSTPPVESHHLASGKQVESSDAMEKSDQEDSALPGLKVVRLKDGGVAATSEKIAVGDRVIAVDGNEISLLSAVEVNRLLVGAEGSVAGELLFWKTGK